MFLLEAAWTETDLILIKHQIVELFIAIELKEETKEILPFPALQM